MNMSLFGNQKIEEKISRNPFVKGHEPAVGKVLIESVEELPDKSIQASGEVVFGTIKTGLPCELLGGRSSALEEIEVNGKKASEAHLSDEVKIKIKNTVLTDYWKGQNIEFFEKQ